MSERLSEALDDWGQGVMAFQAEMEKQLEGTEVTGRTHPAIRRYLDGQATPSVEWLRVAARVLGVRAAWLAGFHDGAKTEEAERLRILALAETSPADDFFAQRRTMAKEELKAAFGPRVMPFGHQAVLRAWDHVKAQPTRDLQSSGTDGFRLFVRMLAAPVNEVEEDREPLRFQELENYIVEAAPVVARLLAEYVREHRIGAGGR